jgi:hypothetical protein
MNKTETQERMDRFRGDALLRARRVETLTGQSEMSPLAKVRIRAGISEAAAARIAGLDEVKYQLVEAPQKAGRAHMKMSVDAAERLGRAFGVKLPSFFEAIHDLIELPARSKGGGTVASVLPSLSVATAYGVIAGLESSSRAPTARPTQPVPVRTSGGQNLAKREFKVKVGRGEMPSGMMVGPASVGRGLK